MGDIIITEPTGWFNSTIFKIKCAFYKFITTICFIIFPTKLSSLFANLTIISLIYTIKGLAVEDKIINNKNLNALFDTYINEKILVFPRATIWIFWSSKTLNRSINLDGYKTTIAQAIEDKEIFDRYKRRIVDYLIRDLPMVVKFRLGLNDRTMAVMFRNNVIQALNSI